GWMHTRVSARIELPLSGGEPVIFGPEAGTPVRVGGPVRELAGWLTGRCPGDRLTAPGGLPELPSWL
ncbi:MAG: hypothetical protein ACRD0H_13740, partial [Actinomycetes bacterium]